MQVWLRKFAGIFSFWLAALSRFFAKLVGARGHSTGGQGFHHMRLHYDSFHSAPSYLLSLVVSTFAKIEAEAVDGSWAVIEPISGVFVSLITYSKTKCSMCTTAG